MFLVENGESQFDQKAQVSPPGINVVKRAEVETSSGVCLSKACRLALGLQSAGQQCWSPGSPAWSILAPFRYTIHPPPLRPQAVKSPESTV